MNTMPSDVLTIAELQRLLRQVEPAALLVPSRILRRVIKKDRGLVGPGLQVPHRKSYIVARDRLLHFVSADELGLSSGWERSPILVLLPQPDHPRLAECKRARTLLKYWRLLFHARVHWALQTHHHERRSHIQRIGLTEFHEATAVLRQEHYLLPPGDAATAYEEFAAVYLELRYFAPHLLPLYFPACSSPEKVEAVLTEEVAAADLFAATRLPGAPDPLTVSSFEQETTLSQRVRNVDHRRDSVAGVSLLFLTGNVPRSYRHLLQHADKASAHGNMIRAAILRMRAAQRAASERAELTHAAYQEMERFSRRLQNALDYSDAVAADWQSALLALLEPASRGVWPNERRMLYDLQKACLDRERPVYAVDLVEWIVSWGRRPIKRLLPFHDSVRMVKHLRSALRRLTFIHIAEPIRRRLRELLIEVLHQAEQRLRQRLRPVIRAALDRVNLTPHNLAEEVARDKVVEELIDLVVEHGFLSMSDLRDAIARNRLKLPDLTGRNEVVTAGESNSSSLVTILRSLGRGLGTFFLGDSLIRANRQLASDLDGVYRRGEIYLRWLQRLSAAAFGTHIGRLLTLYLALPFGCALAVLKVWDEVIEHLYGGPPEDSAAAREAAKHVNPYAFTLLSLFFWALFHIGSFRHALLGVGRKIWHGLRWCSHDLLPWLLHLPWVMGILQSRPWLFLFQFVLKPLPWTVFCTLAMRYWGWDWEPAYAAGAIALVTGSLLLNSRWGAYLEETATDSLMRTWHLIHGDLVPGLVRWIIYLYRRWQEEVERLIYTVDEWLRFRPGDSKLSLIAKPILGLIWFGITYLFRMIFNLFVEPTFNPIKHFPTVTVTAKLLVPIYPELLNTFRTPVKLILSQTLSNPKLVTAVSNTVALTAIGLLPGLAGFLVWELKENWRLYRANQAPTLRPEIVGHHGETMLRLMRPGFHSGTLPKLYARLRHGRSPRKQQETLYHLRERLKHFVERNLFAILAGSKSWGNAVPLRVGEIHIATNRIRLELAGPTSSIQVDFEQRGGWLLAGLTCPDAVPQSWLSRLRAEQAMAFRDALAGFYKLAGADVVRQQIETQISPGTVYDLTEKGLVVWPLSAQSSEKVYDLENSPCKEALLYSATPISWDDWVQTWQRDHEGKGHLPLLPLHLRLLPESEQPV